MPSELLLLSGAANSELSKKIAKSLGQKLGDMSLTHFADGETRVEIVQNIRGSDVFVIQPTCTPVNEHIMEALIIVDACRRASAQTITLVTPYFGYARQERKSAPRTPITAKLVAEIIEASGVNRLLTLELHNGAIQGFFNIPVDHLFSKPIFVDYLEDRVDNNYIIVSPDAGGVERARALAKHLNLGLAIIDKRRERPNESSVMHIVGNVSGKDCLIVDDIVDTGGSLVKGAAALVAGGARSVSAIITHPVLSKPALSRIAESPLQELVVTDSVPLSAEAKSLSKIKQVSVAGLLAEAIRRIHEKTSVSSLFL